MWPPATLSTIIDWSGCVRFTTLSASPYARLTSSERANIGVAAVGEGGDIRLRVWERGAGITRACGSGACAALVAAHRRGLAGRRAPVELDGGTLDIVWREDGHVIMTGPVALSFEGAFDPSLLAGP